MLELFPGIRNSLKEDLRFVPLLLQHKLWLSFIRFQFTPFLYHSCILPCDKHKTLQQKSTTHRGFLPEYNPFSVDCAGRVAVGKISAFQPQGPQFDPWLCRDLNPCSTFFSVSANSAFQLVNEWTVSARSSKLIRLTLWKPEISASSNEPLGLKKHSLC